MHAGTEHGYSAWIVAESGLPHRCTTSSIAFPSSARALCTVLIMGAFLLTNCLLILSSLIYTLFWLSPYISLFALFSTNKQKKTYKKQHTIPYNLPTYLFLTRQFASGILIHAGLTSNLSRSLSELTVSYLLSYQLLCNYLRLMYPYRMCS